MLNTFKQSGRKRLLSSPMTEVFLIGPGITIIADINRNCTNSANWTAVNEEEWVRAKVKWRRCALIMFVDGRSKLYNA